MQLTMEQGTDNITGAERLRRRAHDRLDEMFDRAVNDKLYGRVSVEVIFKDGVAVNVGRTHTGQDQ